MVSQSEDFVVCVAHPNKSAYSETFIRAHIENLPAKVIDLQGVWFPLRYDKSELKKFLLQNNVDAVLAEFGPTGVAMMDICQEVGLPLIVHFHGADANRNDIVSGEIGKYYPELFHKAAAIVTPSNFLRERLLQLGASSKKVKTNYNGVDTSLFTEASPDLSPPTFIAVSRFVDVKGPHLSILAFKKVVEACHDARLIMVGDGPLLESCQQLARALKISSFIDFLGVKQHSEIIDIMRSGRAFIQHSIRTSDGQCEALGIVFLEAGASGLPVVATFSGGIPEVVIDGETGFLVEESDVNTMADYMLKLAENPDLAAQLGKAARVRISTNFSMDKSSNGLWKIVKEAIDEQKAIDQIININFKEINLIIFPDWSQPEDILLQQLEMVIKVVINHYMKSNISLIIYVDKIPGEEANLILSSIFMELVLRGELEVETDGCEIVLLEAISESAWELLLSHKCALIPLENEKKPEILGLKSDYIPLIKIEDLAQQEHIKTSKINSTLRKRYDEKCQENQDKKIIKAKEKYEDVKVNFENKSFWIRGFCHDHITKQLKTGNFYETDLLSEIFKRYGTGGTYVDVGAFIGNHTIFFAKVCQADLVISIEPEINSCEVLRHNLKINKIDNYEVYNVAIGNRDAYSKTQITNPLNLGANKTLMSSVSEDKCVPMKTLDSLIKYPPKLIKIDTEGWSFPVLAGATNLLINHHPIIVVETFPDSLETVQNFLGTYGYFYKGTFALTPTHIFEYM